MRMQICSLASLFGFRILSCSGCAVAQQLQLPFNPCLGASKRWKKKKKERKFHTLVVWIYSSLCVYLSSVFQQNSGSFSDSHLHSNRLSVPRGTELKGLQACLVGACSWWDKCWPCWPPGWTGVRQGTSKGGPKTQDLRRHVCSHLCRCGLHCMAWLWEQRPP